MEDTSLLSTLEEPEGKGWVVSILHFVDFYFSILWYAIHLFFLVSPIVEILFPLLHRINFILLPGWRKDSCPAGRMAWEQGLQEGSVYLLLKEPSILSLSVSGINHIASLLSPLSALIWAFLGLFCYDSFICFLLPVFCCYCLLSWWGFCHKTKQSKPLHVFVFTWEEAVVDTYF